jgi:phosphoribosylanthranilate isomerase
MAMWVKICANTNLQDALLAAELGADAVGFVFAPSKRQVTAEEVAAITPGLPSSVCRVGVFATKDAVEIVAAVESAGLNAVQLHGTPDAALLEELSESLPMGVQIVQTVAYTVDADDRESSDERFVQSLSNAMMHPAVSMVLLDTANAGASGGLGVAFDWAHVAPLVERGRAGASANGKEVPRLILAGGLRAENVQAAIAELRPDGVDVASGVEARPGFKNPERLREFLAAARG